jgi:hypothetical protein
MGLVLTDLSDEQKKELDIKNGVGVEEISGSARGDIQAGDIILALISRGTTIDAKSAEQLNAQIAKVEKGGSVTLLLRRGERRFHSTIKLGNGSGKVRKPSTLLAVLEPGQRRLTLFVRAYCHLCDDMRHALAPLAAMFRMGGRRDRYRRRRFLEQRWGEAVPVLVAGEQELCRYRIDAAAVTPSLRARRKFALMGEIG